MALMKKRILGESGNSSMIARLNYELRETPYEKKNSLGIHEIL